MKLKMAINVELTDATIEELATSLLQAASDVLHDECDAVPDCADTAEYSDALHQILTAAYSYVNDTVWRLNATEGVG